MHHPNLEKLKALKLFGMARALEDLNGLQDRVAREAEVFGVLDEVDVFLYSFSEGLTARRSSVQAAAASGKPVVVNAPARPGGFDHHPTYRRLIEAGSCASRRMGRRRATWRQL